MQWVGHTAGAMGRAYCGCSGRRDPDGAREDQRGPKGSRGGALVGRRGLETSSQRMNYFGQFKLN